MNKQQRIEKHFHNEYWQVVFTQLVRVCGLSPEKAEEKVRKTIEGLINAGPGVLTINYHSNPEEWTYALGVPFKEDPPGASSWEERSEGMWFYKNKDELLSICSEICDRE